MILLQILTLGAAVLGALFYFGYGVARVIVPAHFAAWRVLLVPFVGMALIIVWDYLALYAGIDLTRATWALVFMVTLLNLVTVAREWRIQGTALFRITLPREQWLVLAFAFLAFAAAVAPLVRYGEVTIIGENWDYENSMPLADYLRTYTMQTLAHAPANPLLTGLTGQHIAPLPWAFSYVLATFNTLLNRDALDLFAILLAVLRGLGVIAAFLFCRATLKQRPRAALLATGLYSANGLMLWFTYWSFGPHDTALALLPLALAAGIVALHRAGGRSIVFAALLLAALNIAFNPAFTLTLALLGVIGAYYFLFPEPVDAARSTRGAAPERRRVVLTGLALLGLTFLSSFPTVIHVQDLYREYYATTGRAPAGVREFAPLSDGLGLSLYTLEIVVGHIIPTPIVFSAVQQIWNILSVPLLFFVGLISGWGLVAIARDRTDPPLTRGERATWFLLVGMSALYLALLRLPFLRPYPYGFLKALSLVNLPLLALFAQGFFHLPAQPRVIAWTARAGMATVIALVLVTFALTIEQYFKPQPPFFNDDALKLRELKNHVAENAEIFLTDRAEVQKIPMGLAAYALLQNPLRGNVTTGYGALNNAEPQRVYDYALLARGEDPAARGYENRALWSNQSFALYPRAQDVVAHNALNAQTIAPQTLTLTLGAQEIISGTKTISTTQGVRDVTIALAAFVPQSVRLTLGNKTTDAALSPGLLTFTAANVSLPATLVITPTVDAKWLDAARTEIPHQLPNADPTLFVPYIQLRQAHAAQNSQTTVPAIMVRCTNENASELDTRCFVVNPNGEALTWRWIVRGTTAGTREERVLAQVDATGAPRARVDLSAVRTGIVYVQFDDASYQSFSTPALPDGKYRGALEILRGDVLLARIPLYNFEIKNQGKSLTRDTPKSPPVILAP